MRYQKKTWRKYINFFITLCVCVAFFVSKLISKEIMSERKKPEKKICITQCSSWCARIFN